MPNIDLNILNDHYKDTFLHIKTWEDKRDKAFSIMIVIIGFLVIGVNYPEILKAVFTEATVSKTKLDLTKLPVSILVSIGWTYLFSIVLKHCQCAITVERQYKYLHLIENKFEIITGDSVVFQREGKAYIDNYPAFSKWSYMYHTVVFPVIIVSLSVILIVIEVRSGSGMFYLYYDGLMIIGIFTSFFLYRVYGRIEKRKK